MGPTPEAGACQTLKLNPTCQPILLLFHGCWQKTGQLWNRDKELMVVAQQAAWTSRWPGFRWAPKTPDSSSKGPLRMPQRQKAWCAIKRHGARGMRASHHKPGLSPTGISTSSLEGAANSTLRNGLSKHHTGLHLLLKPRKCREFKTQDPLPLAKAPSPTLSPLPHPHLCAGPHQLHDSQADYSRWTRLHQKGAHTLIFGDSHRCGIQEGFWAIAAP